MKLVCTQRALAEGLATVDRAVPSKSPLPVLSNVLLSTEGSQLKLVANNLEMAIKQATKKLQRLQGRLQELEEKK